MQASAIGLTTKRRKTSCATTSSSKKQDTAEQFFYDLFEIASPNDPEARWMSATEILAEIKKHAKGLVTNPSAVALGRTLKAIKGMKCKHTKLHNCFCVKPLF